MGNSGFDPELERYIEELLRESLNAKPNESLEEILRQIDANDDLEKGQNEI